MNKFERTLAGFISGFAFLLALSYIPLTEYENCSAYAASLGVTLTTALAMVMASIMILLIISTLFFLIAWMGK